MSRKCRLVDGCRYPLSCQKDHGCIMKNARADIVDIVEGRVRPIQVTLKPARVYVRGHRIHHFWLGVILIASDWRDWRVWITDLLKRS